MIHCYFRGYSFHLLRKLAMDMYTVLCRQQPPRFNTYLALEFILHYLLILALEAISYILYK